MFGLNVCSASASALKHSTANPWQVPQLTLSPLQRPLTAWRCRPGCLDWGFRLAFLWLCILLSRQSPDKRGSWLLLRSDFRRRCAAGQAAFRLNIKSRKSPGKRGSWLLLRSDL